MRRFITLAGFVLMTSSVLAADLTDTGASSAFTSDDPVVKSALLMIDAGNFTRAEKLIATTQPSSDPSVTQSREEILGCILRRDARRNDYSSPTSRRDQ